MSLSLDGDFCAELWFKSFIFLIIIRSNNLYFMLRLYHNICCWSSKFYYIFRCSLMLLGLACIKEGSNLQKMVNHIWQEIKEVPWTWPTNDQVTDACKSFHLSKYADDGYRFLYSQQLMVVENIYKSILLKKIKFLIRLNFV